MKYPLCRIDEIPDHGTQRVPFFGREVHVYKLDGIAKAVLNVCLHVGGPLARDGDRFVCEWHQAEFGARDGGCVKPPAPADSRLMFLPTRIEDGVLTYVWGE